MKTPEPAATFTLTELQGLMHEALREAENALPIDVPVGALLLDEEKRIIARGFNTRARDTNPLGHAELNALAMAASARGDWRLNGCTLIVSLEPCAMCAGALAQSRVSQIVYGAADTLAGGCGGSAQRIDWPPTTLILGGVLSSECEVQLKTFFGSKR